MSNRFGWMVAGAAIAVLGYRMGDVLGLVLMGGGAVAFLMSARQLVTNGTAGSGAPVHEDANLEHTMRRDLATNDAFVVGSMGSTGAVDLGSSDWGGDAGGSGQ